MPEMAGTIRIQVCPPFTISKKGEAMIPIPLCVQVITVVAAVVAGKELLED
jgi:hypothetical protein